MKIFRSIVFLLLSLVLIFLLLTKWNFDNVSAFDTIASFLSITSGFTITALSIIATSPFSLSLYQLEDKKDNSRTLLHILVGEFRNSMYLFISTITLILIHKFFLFSQNTLFHLKCFPISLFGISKSIIWYLTTLSIISFISLFIKFSKFVTKSALTQHKRIN
jgi:hypothetical protein